jgi:hypothetical protein
MYEPIVFLFLSLKVVCYSIYCKFQRQLLNENLISTYSSIVKENIQIQHCIQIQMFETVITLLLSQICLMTTSPSSLYPDPDI